MFVDALVILLSGGLAYVFDRATYQYASAFLPITTGSDSVPDYKAVAWSSPGKVVRTVIALILGFITGLGVIYADLRVAFGAFISANDIHITYPGV